MASPPFTRWQRLGKPITPARPVTDLVARLKAAFPRGSFGWYADTSHYEAEPPQDHTPYSADGWPLPDPEWVVCALDVMATAVGGVAVLDGLFTYWLAEARAGRLPWLKYLIWRAHIYDVRFGWRQQPASDHFDHVHLSTRTDHITTTLGGWSVLPPAAASPGGDMTPQQEELLLKQVNDINFILWRGGPGNATDFRTYFAELKGLLNTQAAQLTAQGAIIEALAAAIHAGGGTVDTAAVLAGVDQRLAALRTQVEADTRDAVGDLAAGGEQAVRADT